MKIVSSIAVAALDVAGPACAQTAAPAATTGAAPNAGATPMRPGLWETIVAVETVGSNGKRTTVSRACYAARDVADAVRVLPRQREPGMKCENLDAKTRSANATWRVACALADGTLAGTAALTLTGTTYSGQAALKRNKPGAKAEKVAEALSGKWLEACK